MVQAPAHDGLWVLDGVRAEGMGEIIPLRLLRLLEHLACKEIVFG